jgi:hypothetical protein
MCFNIVINDNEHTNLSPGNSDCALKFYVFTLWSRRARPTFTGIKDWHNNTTAGIRGIWWTVLKQCRRAKSSEDFTHFAHHWANAQLTRAVLAEQSRRPLEVISQNHKSSLKLQWIYLHWNWCHLNSDLWIEQRNGSDVGQSFSAWRTKH